jgi:TolB-like protein
LLLNPGFIVLLTLPNVFSDFYGYPPGEAGKHDETEEIPADFQKKNPINYKKWTLITVLVLAILIPVAAVTYNIFSNKILASKTVEPEKTIAVLPFKNDSRDTTNAYFINGLMESILNNLSNTPDFNVRSRTSVENYRNTTKSLPEIAKELGVNYIIEGSGQKYGDLVVLNIQLLEANTDRHLLSKQYRREVKEVMIIPDCKMKLR